MSNLRNTEDGRNACLVAQRHLLEKRLSRFFERNVVIDYENWRAGLQEFDIGTMLSAQGELNSAHDDEILDIYTLLGTIGGLPETISELNIYVDFATGSDANGTGSATRPYATLWFVETLPRRLNHAVRIILKSNVSTVYPLHFDFEIGNYGSFSIIGQGAPTVVETGLTVNSATPTAGTAGLIIFTTAVWGANHEMSFLRAIDGIEADRASPVFMSDNAATQLVVNRIPLNGLANGDQIEFIIPSVTLTCPSITFTCRSPQSYDLVNSRASRVAMCNLNIEISDPDNDYYNALKIDNIGSMLLSFVRFVGDISSGQISSEINIENFTDTQLETYANCGILNLNNDTTPLGFVPDCAGFCWYDSVGGSKPELVCDKSSVVYAFCTRKPIYMNHDAKILYGSAGYVKATYGVFRIQTVASYGYISGGLGSGFEFENSICGMSSIDVIDSDNCILVTASSNLTVKNINENPGLGTISGYGIYFFGTGRCELGDAGTAFTGAINDIYFATVNPAVAAAHPAAYLDVNDTQGTQVKRLA